MASLNLAYSRLRHWLHIHFSIAQRVTKKIDAIENIKLRILCKRVGYWQTWMNDSDHIVNQNEKL